MKKYLTTIVLSLLLSGNAYANSNENILYCVDKIKTGSDGKLYNKEKNYKTEKFTLNLDMDKMEVQIDGRSFTHLNAGYMLFSDRKGQSIRLKSLNSSGKKWEYYRSSIFANGDSIWVSSGTCTNFN